MVDFIVSYIVANPAMKELAADADEEEVEKHRFDEIDAIFKRKNKGAPSSDMAISDPNGSSEPEEPSSESAIKVKDNSMDAILGALEKSTGKKTKKRKVTVEEPVMKKASVKDTKVKKSKKEKEEDRRRNRKFTS